MTNSEGPLKEYIPTYWDKVERYARGKLITDSNKVDDIVRKFKYKHGEWEVKKYYTEFDLMQRLKSRSDGSSKELM